MHPSHTLSLEPWSCGTVLQKFAGPDESDWNLHLSNSSYPKARPHYNYPYSPLIGRSFQVIDEARMICAIATFPRFYRTGKSSFEKDRPSPTTLTSEME